MSEELTEEQAQQIMRQYAQGQANMHSFFTNVVETKDTTRTGNLKEEELGLPKVPVRTYQELALFADEVVHQPHWKKYFDKLSEIQTSTSLSKDSMLLKLAVTTKKELADVSPKSKTKNKGWFKSKSQPDQGAYNPQM
jgi:hypothetical protein